MWGASHPSEHQHPEAWPTSTYGHFREVFVSGALDDHWALGRLGYWVHVALSCQVFGRRALSRLALFFKLSYIEIEVAMQKY